MSSSYQKYLMNKTKYLVEKANLTGGAANNPVNKQLVLLTDYISIMHNNARIQTTIGNIKQKNKDIQQRKTTIIEGERKLSELHKLADTPDNNTKLNFLIEKILLLRETLATDLDALHELNILLVQLYKAENLPRIIGYIVSVEYNENPPK